MSGPENVSQTDVARMAMVTQATVSMVFNGHKGISEATRQRVLKAAEALDYHPNRNIDARRLAYRQSKNNLRLKMVGYYWQFRTVGTIMQNSFYQTIFLSIADECSRQGLSLLLLNVDDDLEVELGRASMIDALILPSHPPEIVERAVKLVRNIPLVSLLMDHLGYCDVGIDDSRAMAMIYEHLLSKGHSRIGYVSPYLDFSGNARSHGLKRWNGFMEQCRKAGMHSNMSTTWTSDNRAFEYRQEGARGFRTLWEKSPHPTAIVFYNDMMALGALDEAARMGVDVPGDVSFIAIDDIPEAARARVPLTTVSIELEEIGRLAVRTVNRFVMENYYDKTPVLIEMKLKERASVRKL
ncbi:MAG: LacI family DNA-binding transcriptional regulator [Verrucomicrobiae bacterium]|nr:LacI family DNA-binding transcriptional regulator [Verrucomicrobiae bacterium]